LRGLCKESAKLDTYLVVLAQAISLRNPLLTGEAGCMLLQQFEMPCS
jgi:hypothetical protein